jgi:hypothetical protein
MHVFCVSQAGSWGFRKNCKINIIPDRAIFGRDLMYESTSQICAVLQESNEKTIFIYAKSLREGAFKSTGDLT